MSEERKKRETSEVNQPPASTDTTPILTKNWYTSEPEAGDINNEPHLGPLILETYRTSVPTINPDKILFDYTDNLVSVFYTFSNAVEGSITVQSHIRRIFGIIGNYMSQT
jgi:hypothetical protein